MKYQVFQEIGVKSMKIVVIGSGKVGSAVVGNLMSVRGISQIVLIDQNHDRVEGEILDFSHTTAFAHTPGVNLVAGDYKDCVGADIIIITAGPSIQPGQTRTDLSVCNTKVIREIIGKIDEYNQDSFIIMVTNPVDILTYGAFRYSSRPRHKIIGTGTLIDSARLMKIIGDAYHIDAKNVFAYMLGEHGQTSFAAWSISNICGLSLEEFGRLHVNAKIDKQQVEQTARDIGLAVFNKKGYTNHGIAAGVIRLVISITSDEKCILPVSVVLNGEYGIQDMAVSVPCIIGGNGVEQILEFPLSQEEIKKLQYSADFLKQTITNIQY